MLKIRAKLTLLFFILGLFAFTLPAILLAGGEFKQDLQKKMKMPINIQNIQFEQEAISQQISSYSGTQAGEYLDYDYKGAKQEQGKSIKNAGIERKEEVKRGIKSPTLPLSELPLLGSYVIYKTDYKAKLEEGVVTVKGDVLFEVFKKGLTQIPLVSSSVGLIDVRINKGASCVTLQAGKYYLIIEKPGKYNLDIEFLIKAAREREAGPGSFSFETMPAPISQFEFTMLEADVEIFIEPSIKLEVTKQPNKTIAWAVMPNTNTISVRWTKAIAKEIITPIKLEPKLYADTTTYASIGEGLIRCSTNLNYSILQAEISNLQLALPEDVSILDVQIKDLRDWKTSYKDGLQYLDIYLNFGVKGNCILNLNYERKIGEGSIVAELPWIRPLSVEREKGYIGLAAATNVELMVNKLQHATTIDVRELPSLIWSATTSPLLLAFKYLSHPFSIAIEVIRHEELPVLVAAIDSVDYVTLQTEEGKNLTKAVYQVRNNVKQFLRLALPKDANLWSVFVAAKPVKPAQDKNGSILIPLEKSQLTGESLRQFPVEIVYLDNLSKMGLIGGLKINLPQTDIPISTLNWSVYLPLDYLYFNFAGDVKLTEKEEGIFRVREQRRIMKEARLSRLDQKMREPPTTQFLVPGEYERFAQDLGTAKMQGVLPIKIDIPQQGRLYRFSKLLITEKESPWLSAKFITAFKPLHGFLRLLLLVIILALVAISIKKILRKKTS